MSKRNTVVINLARAALVVAVTACGETKSDSRTSVRSEAPPAAASESEASAVEQMEAPTAAAVVTEPSTVGATSERGGEGKNFITIYQRHLGSGCYRVLTTGYYSNGYGSSCPFLWSQFQRICGHTNWDWLPHRLDHGYNVVAWGGCARLPGE